MTTIAGSATTGYLDNANPLSAKFNFPRGVAVDDNGNVYVSEGGGYIRKIAYSNGAYGAVTTVASSLGSPSTVWGMLVVTPDGSTIYASKVSDKKIYKIDTAGNMGMGTGAALTTAFTNVPMGLSFDNSGNIIVREMTSGFTYQVTPSGVVTTLNSAIQYGNAQAIQLADGSYLSALSTTISRISPPNKAVVVGGGGTAGALGFGTDAGFAEIITGAGEGGGPHVKVYNGRDLGLIKEFMAYSLDFRGGVNVAAGDYLSDGKFEIITGAGAGGGPNVKIWDYETLNLDGQIMAYTNLTLGDGEVIDALFSGGVRVALADANGDNVLDLLTGAGPGGGPHVKVFVGFRLELLMSFFSGDKNDRRGIFVSQ